MTSPHGSMSNLRQPSSLPPRASSSSLQRLNQSNSLTGLNNNNNTSQTRLQQQSSMTDLTTVLSNASGVSANTRKTENVTVAVRVRPLSDSEMRDGQQHIWECVPGHAGKVFLSDEWKERLRKQASSVEYIYDQMYVGSENEQMYVSSVGGVVRSAMEGFNATVFAYGQTSSGKTYSMMGFDGNPGVIPLAIEDVFDYIRETREQREFLLRVSYMEIYNETIRDLLNPENSDLKIHEDKHRGIYVSPLKEEIVTTISHVMNLLAIGEENRHVSSTDYNERSSRSHTIFQIVIESRERHPGSPSMTALARYRAGTAKSSVPVRFSCLNLIDLAGSEKASSSLDRRREGAFINKSLLTLGTVISKLTEDKSGHVPFRDSKLTRILQPSLQGNARVSVICTISPALSNFEESHNTLKFAQRIKKVVTKAHTTEIMDDRALLQRYKNEIDELRTKLTELSDKEVESSHLAAEKLRLEEELSQQEVVRAALVDRIDQLTKYILTSSSTATASNSIMSPFRPQSIVGDGGATGQSAKQRRLSLIPPTSPISPVDTQKLHDDLKSSKAANENLLKQINGLQKDLIVRDSKVAELEFEVKILNERLSTAGRSIDASAVSTDLVLSLRKELLESQEQNRKIQERLVESEKVVERLEMETMRMRMQSPSSPVESFYGVVGAAGSTVSPTEDEVSALKERIAKLELQLKEKQLKQPKDAKEEDILNTSPPPFLTDGVSLQVPPALKSTNAKMLASLVPKTPMSSKSGSFIDLPTPERTPQKDLFASTDMERLLKAQELSHEKIAELDTDLTIVRAELAAAQLLNSMAPKVGASKSFKSSKLPSPSDGSEIDANTTRTSSLQELDKLFKATDDHK